MEIQKRKGGKNCKSSFNIGSKAKPQSAKGPTAQCICTVICVAQNSNISVWKRKQNGGLEAWIFL